MKALINANIFDFENYRENYYVLFNKEIEEVGPMGEFPGAHEIYDCNNAIVMPGLVNGHTHIYSTFARGMNAPFNPKSFTDILEQLWWKLDAKLDKEAVYYSGLISACECIKNGVTTVIDHHASGLNIRGTLEELKRALCDEMGMRGIFCFETSDRFNVEECIEENLSFMKNKTEKYAGLFGMHASMSLSNETLSKISSKLGNNPIHIHVGESLEDEYDSTSKYGKSVIERLQEFNLINDDSILAHCVHISKKEADIIAESGALAALNPTSNMNNTVGLPNYKVFRKKKIKCILGNDGLGMNITRDYMNVVFAMKNRLKSPTAFSLEDLVQIIDNGYTYAGKRLGIKLGRIKKGFKADMLVVPYMPPTVIDSNNALGHIFYGVFDNFHPQDVWCDGRRLMKDYRLNFNTHDIYAKAQVEASKVWKRMNI